MLAGTPDSNDDIKFPCLASPKLDGIRAANKNGKLLSRSLKLIPNKLVQSILSMPELHGLDGELICGPVNDPNVMQNTSTVVMSIEKQQPFEFHVFDFWDSTEGKRDRLIRAGSVLLSIQKRWRDLVTVQRLLGAPREIMSHLENCPLRLVPHKLIETLDELEAFEAECLEAGYEGVMVCAPDGAYKYGRSTVKEGGLLKLKRFSDAEAIVVGFEEEMKNENTAQVNELGRTKRSTAKAGLTGKGTLGAFVCKRVFVNEKGKYVLSDYTFNIGTGMTAEFRASVWANRDAHMGAIVKFKHFEHGVVDAPRHPVFLGFRAPEDMS
jgi:DNA ligase-1